jgi:mersacidin/lichenicidin family type 2 lantibiotic
MMNVDVVRAWKDPKYRRSLSAEQLECLPTNPAGRLELTDEQMRAASGLKGEAAIITTAWFCTLYTFLARCCG